MQEKLNIAVFVDYDNIEIGVKSTLRREFDVSLPLDALKEHGDLVAKFVAVQLVPWRLVDKPVGGLAELDQGFGTAVDFVEIAQGNAFQHHFGAVQFFLHQF